MKNSLYVTIASLCLLLALDSCNTSRMNCPGFSAKKSTHSKGGGNGYAYMRHKKEKNKLKTETATTTPKGNENSGGGLFALGGGKEKAFEFKLPKSMAINAKDEEIAAADEIFKKQSNNKVQLVKENNKLILKAKSKKEVQKLILKQLKQQFKKPKYASTSAVAAGGGSSGLALASGIIGIIAFVFAFGPYVGFLGLALGIVALILGIVSAGSSPWATVGIILGALAILISILFLFVVFAAMIF